MSAEQTMLPFVDLAAQRARIGSRIDAAVQKVLAGGMYVLGPEVGQLEAELAAFAGVRHAIACSNGTDALVLALRAAGIGPGDAVLVPAFTFAATAEAVVLAGATPVFVDVLEADFNIDPGHLEQTIDWLTRENGPRPRAIIPVDLFGQPADYHAIAGLAAQHGLTVIADAAQSFGARFQNRPVGTLADISATSFYPAKPLGCYGDGGAVFTDSDELAGLMRSIRVHGAGTHRYEHARIGLNARLDTIQAAVLLEKLKIFPEEIEARQKAADAYTAALQDIVATPRLLAGRTSVWAQYTLRVAERDALQKALAAAGVPTAIYYPIPLNAQTAYRDYPTGPGGTPVSDRLAGEVLSLPMHAYLDAGTLDRIVGALRAAVSGQAGG